MNQKLTGKQYALLASMLFGMFFGAGNLIFPIILGAKAGASLVPALLGMLITAVGMPLLGPPSSSGEPSWRSASPAAAV